MTLSTTGIAGDDQQRSQQQQQPQLERSQRAVFHRIPAAGATATSSVTTPRTVVTSTRTTLTKHSTSNGPAAVTIRSSKLLPASTAKREPLVKKVLSVVPTANAAATVGDAAKRLVPSIAVNMKQRLKTTTETIKGERVVKVKSEPPATITASAKRTLLAKTRNIVAVPVEPSEMNLEQSLTARMESLNLDDVPAQEKQQSGAVRLQREGFFERPSVKGEVPETELLDTVGTPRMRTSTMKRSHASRSQTTTLPKDINGLSPVKGVKQQLETVKDKSAKRKSFLNRSQTEEPAAGARSATSSTAVGRYQRRLKMPHSSPDMYSSSNRSSPVKSSSSTEKSPTNSPRPPSCSSNRSSPKHGGVVSPETVSSKAGSSPIRICSRLSGYTSGTGTINNSPSPCSQPRSPSLSYHMEQARRELVISPPRTNRLLKIVTESASDPLVPQLSAMSIVNEPTLPSDAGAQEAQAESEANVEVAEPEEVAVEALVAEDVDEISEEQSSSIGQYSKFSQILKSPTLEVVTISDMLGDLAIADRSSMEIDAQERMEVDEDAENDMQVPLIMGQQIVLDEVVAIAGPAAEEDMEAGPSGLCVATNGDKYDCEDDEEEEDEEEVAGEERVMIEPPARGYVAVVDVGDDDDHQQEEIGRPANRILFDNQFNDEFVVIENSPKSQLIQSLDEADIIVLRDNDDEEDYGDRPPSRPSSGGYLEKKKKLVKMSSVEHFERKSLSPQRVGKLSTSSSCISRAKSMDESSAVLGGSSSASAGANSGTSANHIVSILKRKTVESSAAAS
uniref:Uncharacterized protein n=1 Tax=Anopheles maculatus TaxID=74869 RepID=A0A182SF08_9DIPT